MYKQKYLKYKAKYLRLKYGGNESIKVEYGNEVISIEEINDFLKISDINKIKITDELKKQIINKIDIRNVNERLHFTIIYLEAYIKDEKETDKIALKDEYNIQGNIEELKKILDDKLKEKLLYIINFVTKIQNNNERNDDEKILEENIKFFIQAQKEGRLTKWTSLTITNNII